MVSATIIDILFYTPNSGQSMWFGLVLLLHNCGTDCTQLRTYLKHLYITHYHVRHT